MRLTELWTLRIEHDYYWDRIVLNFDVRVSKDNSMFLARHDLLWRQKNVNEWCLLYMDDINMTDSGVLELELITRGEELHYVTDLIWPGPDEWGEVKIPVENNTIVVRDCMTIKEGEGRFQSNIIKLSVPISEIIKSKVIPVTTTLLFHTIHKYWEYIFLPRQMPIKTIRLEDTSKTINFGEAEPIKFQGYDAFQIRSLERFGLRQSYGNISLRLWGTLQDSTNERLLIRSIPFPEPRLNMILSSDAVNAVVYC